MEPLTNIQKQKSDSLTKDKLLVWSVAWDIKLIHVSPDTIFSLMTNPIHCTAGIENEIIPVWLRSHKVPKNTEVWRKLFVWLSQHRPEIVFVL